MENTIIQELTDLITSHEEQYHEILKSRASLHDRGLSNDEINILALGLSLKLGKIERDIARANGKISTQRIKLLKAKFIHAL